MFSLSKYVLRLFDKEESEEKNKILRDSTYLFGLSFVFWSDSLGKRAVC